MSPDEAPLSTHPASQAWFAMLLANDPNTALLGALRTSREHPLWAALRRPFEGQAPQLASLAREAEIPGLRSRSAPWIGAGLLLTLGVVLAAVGLGRVPLAAPEALTSVAALPGERLATTTLQVRPALSPPVAAPIASNVVPPTIEPVVQAREQPTAVLARAASTAVPASSPAKKKPAARRLRRDNARAIRPEKLRGAGRGPAVGQRFQ